MAANDYHFVTRWRVVGTLSEVADLLGNPKEYTRWWPSVYLEVEESAPGDEGSVGKTALLLTKGWLPYTLTWRLRVTESRYPNGFTFEAKGDFVGRGIWTFQARGAWVDATFDWKIRVEKPLLALFSPLLAPLFAANHRWAMRQGEESLRLELSRRHAATPAERARVPSPPSPTTSSPVALLAAAAGLFLLSVALGRLFSRRARRRSPLLRRF